MTKSLNMKPLDIPPDLSVKLRNINFVCTLLIIVLHANTISLLEREDTFIYHFENLLANGICRIAVPYFFLAAGFFFFCRFQQGFYWNIFFQQIGKRCRTLVVPYLVVVGIFWCLMFLLKRMSLFPAIQLDVSPAGILKYIFVNPRYSYPLWFIRDLFVLCVFAPILYYPLARLKLAIPTIAVIIAICLFVRPELYLFRPDSLAYFALGAFLKLHYRLANSQMPNRAIALLALWFFLCVVVELIKMKYLFLLRDFCGIIAVWCCYDIFVVKPNDRAWELAGYSFFLYLFHEPLLSLFKTTLWNLVSKGDGVALVIYFFAIIIVIPVLFIAAYCSNRYCPKIYQIVCGGR